MMRIIRTEFLKLKNFSILWIGFSAMLACVLLTRFMATASDGTEYNFLYFASEVIWNGMTLIFPSTIALIGGYIVERERKDDTLKNLSVIPISFRQMLVGKAVVTAIICVILSIIEFLFTVIVSLISGYAGIAVDSAMKVIYQMIMINLCVFISVLPVVELVSQKAGAFINGVAFSFFYGFLGVFASGHKLTNIYPITAGLSLVNYQSDEPLVLNKSVSFWVLLVMLLISGIIIIFSKDRNQKHTKKGENIKINLAQN